jgi:hypothetical protein
MTRPEADHVPASTNQYPNVDQATWYSRASLRAAALTYLSTAGWSIRRVAPAHRAPLSIHDLADFESHHIEAEQGGVHLFLEIIEYPDPTHWSEIARQRNDRDPSAPYDPDVLPESWGFSSYSHALFTGPDLRERHPDARIVQLYPLIGLYRSLDDPDDASLSVQPLNAYESAYMNVELWLVREDGTLFQRVLSQG